MGGKKMNYKKNGLNRLNGIKRSMAFILMLAMVITSLGISGWSTDEVYAAEGEGTATVRIVGPDNQFVITEASIEIDPGVTTLGAVVAEACSDYGIGSLELSTGEYGGWPSTIGGIDINGSFWMNTLNDYSPSENYTIQTANDGDNIVLYPYSAGEYSRFSILTNSAVTTSAGYTDNYYIQGTVTLNLEKTEPYSSSGFKGVSVSSIAVQDVNGNDMVEYEYGPDYFYDLVYSKTGPVKIKFWGDYSGDNLPGFSKTYIITSEENGIVKPYLRIVMTPGGFAFSQPLPTDPFEMTDPPVSHKADRLSDVASVIAGIRDVNDSHEQTYYDNDWALAMFAAGETPTSSERSNYLKVVLNTVSGAGLGKAKTAIALATLGIDARYIPIVDKGEPINIVEQIINEPISGQYAIYSLPTLLSFYDLGIYDVNYGATTTREMIIQKIMDNEGTSSWSQYGNDFTGMVLPALAPYYNKNEVVNGISAASCQAITSSIDNAVNYLADSMGQYGAFSYYGSLNSNTQATVLTGIHALGINTHPDNVGNFYKLATGLDNLFLYRTSDNKLGYKYGNKPDSMASKQGMGALATYQNMISNNGRSSNIYHFDTTVTQYTDWPDADLLTGIQVFPDVTNYNLNETVNPNTITVQAIYNGDYSTATTVVINADNVTHAAFGAEGNYTVTVNYLGEESSYVVSVGTASTAPVGPSISAKIHDGNTVIASNSQLMIEGGRTSALSALRMLAAEKGISLVVRGGYVSEINGIGEFARGENSGWLYRVNGTTPTTTSSKDYVLKKDDVLEWYYTRDYKSDPSSSAWQKDEEKTSELMAKEDGKGSATVEVSKADMDKLIKDGGALKAKSSIATIEMDAATLKGLGKEMGKDLEIKAKKVDITEKDDISQEMKDKIGDRPVLDLTVMSGTKQISQFDGSVRVSIPYTLKDGEDPSTVIIYLIKDNGEIEVVKNAEFDPATGEVKFTTSHFSLYGIGYKELGFSDIKGHWAKDHISYLAARDYITGMSKDHFAPEGTLTRGQFVQLLANLANVDLKKYGSTEPSSINDVKATDWFAPAVAWAVEQGIVTGITLPDGTTSFYPEKSISRQDIAVMLNRYRDKIDKKEFPEAVKEKAFQDRAQIGDYALDSVKALQKSGIIQGKSETVFAPQDQAKRGEAAKMIHGMLKLN